ncbi:MAG: hypothetical protein GF331_18135 [Chitinivibrionales bacterium]|nr:hypothetical protein [Chitinivibrionales bacterium]
MINTERPCDSRVAQQIAYLVGSQLSRKAIEEARLDVDADRLPDIFPAEEYYCPPPEVIGVEIARRRRGHFNLIHHDTGCKAVCYPLGDDPLHQWGMDNRRRISAPPLPEFWVAPPEYVILRKLEFYREGRSAKHLDDIRAMLEESPEAIDRALIERQVAELRLGPEWDTATQNA